MFAFTLAYLTLVLVMSLVAFAAYGLDKRRARTDKRRIAEKSLHLLAFFGGWPGALIGRRYFRHKTRKVSFLLISWLIIAVHLSLTFCFVYFFVL